MVTAAYTRRPLRAALRKFGHRNRRNGELPWQRRRIDALKIDHHRRVDQTADGRGAAQARSVGS